MTRTFVVWKFPKGRPAPTSYRLSERRWIKPKRGYVFKDGKIKRRK